MTGFAGERWLPVPGYSDLYEVSDTGRIRSLDRVIVRKEGFGVEHKSGRILKQSVHGKGYLGVGLHRNGKCKIFYVHRLVALAFLGDSELGQVNHIDLNKQNNVVGNLEWVTPAQNTQHAARAGRMTTPHERGVHLAINNASKSKKLNKRDVEEIRAMCARGIKQSAIAQQFGISPSNVGKIMRGVSWSEVPFSSKKTTRKNAKLLITIDGKTMTCSQWGRELGVSPDAIKNRFLKYGNLNPPPSGRKPGSKMPPMTDEHRRKLSEASIRAQARRRELLRAA